MKTQSLKAIVFWAALALALVGCGAGAGGGAGQNAGRGASGSAGANTSGNPEAHMDNTRFVPPATTIQTGQSLTLVADTFVPHVIANGTWENGAPKPGREDGAPEVNNLDVAGNQSATIGPFTTAGSFQFYCPIHPGMNLAVQVE